MKKFIVVLFLLSAFVLMNGQNSSLRFNGINENLVLCNKSEYQSQTNFTIEAWIFADAWKSQSWMGSIISKDGAASDGYTLRAGNEGQLSFVFAVDNVWTEIISNPVMNQQQWHHVAATISDNVISLYIDGVRVAFDSFLGEISTNNNDLLIGESAGFSGRYWEGAIDEVRIWNVVRTQQELVDNASIELNGDENGLVLYLPMNEGSGNTTVNVVDPNCSAEFVNMADENWIDGFSISEFDLAINAVEGVDLLNMKSRPIKISAALKNLGVQALDGVELTVSVDGNELFTETMTESLSSGQELSYQLETPVDLIGLVDPTIEIAVSHPNDQNSLNDVTSLSVKTLADSSTIRLFDAERHNFAAAGQNQFNSVTLPSDLSKYESLLLHIEVACPNEGCDPWDQPAKLSASNESGNYEIARYTTPFGIGCGPWTVDVTDFKDLLAGPVMFHSYVQVWGPSGWLVTIDLEFVEGTSDYPHYKSTPLWNTDYLVYGDPGVSYDLEEFSISVDDNTDVNYIRSTISGHGQGNTNNAAEFSSRTHRFQLNGSTIDNHFLWKTDCATNSCANQLGTWLFSRAGWCPGEQVIPYIVNTNATAGADITLDYELEEYTNFLNTGYNDSGHTEPHYRIWSYFVERSGQPFQDYSNLACNSISPTISGEGSSQSLDAVEIEVINDGTTDLSDFELSYYVNGEFITSEVISTPLASSERMTYSFNNVSGFSPDVDNVFFGVVSHPNDENNGDNVSRNSDDNVVSTDDLDAITTDINIYPNPVINGKFQIVANPAMVDSQVDLISIDGKILESTTMTSASIEMNVLENGIYLLRFTHPDGYLSSKKIVVSN